MRRFVQFNSKSGLTLVSSKGGGNGVALFHPGSTPNWRRQDAAAS